MAIKKNNFEEQLNELQEIEDDNLYFQETISWNNNRIKAWKILRKRTS